MALDYRYDDEIPGLRVELPDEDSWKNALDFAIERRSKEVLLQVARRHDISEAIAYCASNSTLDDLWGLRVLLSYSNNLIGNALNFVELQYDIHPLALFVAIRYSDGLSRFRDNPGLYLGRCLDYYESVGEETPGYDLCPRVFDLMLNCLDGGLGLGDDIVTTEVLRRASTTFESNLTLASRCQLLIDRLEGKHSLAGKDRDRSALLNTGATDETFFHTAHAIGYSEGIPYIPAIIHLANNLELENDASNNLKIQGIAGKIGLEKALRTLIYSYARPCKLIPILQLLGTRGWQDDMLTALVLEYATRPGCPGSIEERTELLRYIFSVRFIEIDEDDSDALTPQLIDQIVSFCRANGEQGLFGSLVDSCFIEDEIIEELIITDPDGFDHSDIRYLLEETSSISDLLQICWKYHLTDGRNICLREASVSQSAIFIDEMRDLLEEDPDVDDPVGYRLFVLDGLRQIEREKSQSVGELCAVIDTFGGTRQSTNERVAQTLISAGEGF